MVLTEKSILFPEGSFSANTVLFMYITLKQSPGHMPVAQQGPGWVRRGLLAAVGLAGDQAELVGSMHTEFQSQTRKRECRDMGELATAWSQPHRLVGRWQRWHPREQQLHGDAEVI